MKRNYNPLEVKNRTCSNTDTSPVCDLPGELQFSKFIWVLTDGFPTVLASNVLQHYADHSVTYCHHKKTHSFRYNIVSVCLD
jgi:hypothetical protein